MKDNDQEPRPGQDDLDQAERDAALYGPAGRADHRPGDKIRFTNPQTGGQLAGEILYIRAPSVAIQGGQVSF